MDVRCERCRAQYVFDDEQFTPQGLTVQCTNCGHVFRVKKKELVVTVPVRPEDVTEQPFLAEQSARRPEGRPAAAAPPPPPPPPPAGAPRQGWTIRQPGGVTLGFTELDTLQKWIVERRVSRDDEVSQGDGTWVKLGALAELGPFFDVVAAADLGRAAPPAAHRPATRPGGTDFYPPPPPSFPGLPAAAPPPAAPPPPPSQPRPARAPAALLTSELDPDELAAVRGHEPGRSRLAVWALLVVTLGAAAYVFGPALAGRGASPPQAAPETLAMPPPTPARPAPDPATVAVPLTIELKAPPDQAPPPAPTPEAAPAPAPEPAPGPAPEAKPAPPPPPPPTSKALLAQAKKAREAGEATRALDLYGKALAAQPDNVDALTGRGLCYFELGQYAPAETSFQRALQLDLEHPDAIMGLAETYRQQGKKAEALGLFERYLALHPDGEEAAVARSAISQLKE